MSTATFDVILKKRESKKRNKSNKAVRTLRRALARRKLEQMRDEELLQEQIYDVFEDVGDDV